MAELQAPSQDRLVNRVLEPFETIGHVLDLVEVIQQGGLLRGVLKVDGLDTGEVRLGPWIHRRGRTPATPQQKLAQAMTRAQLILLGGLAGSH
jgi:hypothetical protein